MIRRAWAAAAWLALGAPARAAVIVGADYNDTDLIPSHNDTLQGTFTNVRLFSVGAGSTAFVATGIPLAVYASTIAIYGALDGGGRGQAGGGGGAAAGAGQAGFGGASGGGGGGAGGASAKGGGGAGGAAAGGAGAGAGGGSAGTAYGSTGTATNPLSADDAFLGSGGGGGGGNTTLQGGSGANGGGSIYLEASSMSITGSISVSGSTASTIGDGTGGGTAPPGGGGGGSGGTIILRVPGDLTINSSSLTASGGGGGNIDTLVVKNIDPGGGGSGGRIKIFYRSASFFSVVYSTNFGPLGSSDAAFLGTMDNPSSVSGSSGTVSFGVIASSPTGFSIREVYISSLVWSWNGTPGFGSNPGGNAFRLFTGTSTPPLSAPQISTDSLAVGTTETALTPNTTYFRFVTAYSDWGDSLPSNPVSTYTLANVPGLAAAAFTAMADTAMSVNWGAGSPANPSYTLYEINRSTWPDFSAAVSTSFVTAVSSSPAGLDPNTTYYFRIRAVNIAQIPTAYAAALTTATLASAPASPGFAAVHVTSVAFIWSGGANPGGTPYAVELSTNNFFSVQSSSRVEVSSFTFTDLTPGVQYFFRAKAVNRNSVETAYSSAVFATPGVLSDLAAPAPPGTPQPDRGYSSDGEGAFSWAASTSPVGILDYFLIIGDAPGLSNFFSGSTTSLSYPVTGLSTGKTYYAQVKARSNAGVYSAFSGAGALPVFIPAQQRNVAKPYAWPNPFDPGSGSPAQIAFYLESPGAVTLRIFTLQGAPVRSISQEFTTAGNKIMTWDGKSDSGALVSPGGYVAAVQAKGGGMRKFKIAVAY